MLLFGSDGKRYFRGYQATQAEISRGGVISVWESIAEAGFDDQFTAE